jgi:O-antigen/teichoic acid export membrane protein
VIRSLGWLSLHHGIGRALTFAFFLLLPMIFPLDAVGVFTLWFTAVAVLVQPVFEMPVELSLTTLAAGDRMVDAGTLARAVFRWLPTCAGAGWLVGLAFGAPPVLLGLILLTMVLGRLQATVFALERGRDRPRMEGLVGAGQRVIALAALGLLRWSVGPAPEVPAAALAVGTAAGWLLMLVCFRRPLSVLRTALRLDRSDARSVADLARGAATLGAVAVVSGLYLRLDVLIVGWFDGEAAAGAYFTAARVLDAAAGVAHLIMLAALPRLVRSERFAATLSTFVAGLGVVGTVLGLMVWWVVPGILERLYGPPGLAVVGLAGMFGMVVPVVFVGYVATQGLAVLERRRAWLGIAVAGLAVNLALDLVLVPSMGGAGAVWATLVAELVVALSALAVCLVAARSGRGDPPPPAVPPR